MSKKRFLALVMAATMSVSSMSQGLAVAYAEDSLIEDDVLSYSEDLSAQSANEEKSDPEMQLRSDETEEDAGNTEEEVIPGEGFIIDSDGSSGNEHPGIADYAEPLSPEEEKLLNDILVLPDVEEPGETVVPEEETLLAQSDEDSEDPSAPIVPDTEADTEAGTEYYYETEPGTENIYETETEEETAFVYGLRDKEKGTSYTLLSDEDLNSAVELTLNQVADVNIDYASHPHYILFRFTAPQKDTYRFYSMRENGADPYAELYRYDSEIGAYRYSGHSDDDAGDLDFTVSADLEQGETCYLRGFCFSFDDGIYPMTVVSETKEAEMTQALLSGAQVVPEGDSTASVEEEGETVCLAYTAQGTKNEFVVSARDSSGKTVTARLLNSEGTQIGRFTSRKGCWEGVSFSLNNGETVYLCLRYTDSSATGTMDVYFGEAAAVSSIDSATGIPQKLPKGISVPLPDITVSYTYADTTAGSIAISEENTAYDKYLNPFRFRKTSTYSQDTYEELSAAIVVSAGSTYNEYYEEESAAVSGSFPVTLVSPSEYFEEYDPSCEVTLFQTVSREDSANHYYLFRAPQNGTYSFEISVPGVPEGGYQEWNMDLYDGESGLRHSYLYQRGTEGINRIAQTMKADETVVLSVWSEQGYTITVGEGATPASLTLEFPEKTPSDALFSGVTAVIGYDPALGIDDSRVTFSKQGEGGHAYARDVYGNLVQLTIPEYDDSEEQHYGPGDYTISGTCGGITASGTLHVKSILEYYEDTLEEISFPAELSYEQGGYRQRFLLRVEDTGKYYFTGSTDDYFSFSVYDAQDTVLLNGSFGDGSDSGESGGVVLEADTTYLIQCYIEEEASASLNLMKSVPVSGLSVGGSSAHVFRSWYEIGNNYPLVVEMKDGAQFEWYNWLYGCDVRGNQISCSIIETPDGKSYASFEDMRQAYDYEIENAGYGVYTFLLSSGEISCTVRFKHVTEEEYEEEIANPVILGENVISGTDMNGYYVFTAPEDGYYKFSHSAEVYMSLRQQNGSFWGLTQYRSMKEGDKAILYGGLNNGSESGILLIGKMSSFRIPEGENSVTIETLNTEMVFYADSDECGYRFDCSSDGYVDGTEMGGTSVHMGGSALLEGGRYYWINLYDEKPAPLTVTRVPVPRRLEVSLDKEEYMQLIEPPTWENIRASYDIEQDGSTVSYTYPGSSDMPYQVSLGEIRKYERLLA